MGSAVGPKTHVLFPPRTSALDWCSALAGASWALSVPAACPMAEPRHGPACVHVDRAQDWDGRPRTWGGGGGRPWQAARACCVGSLIDMVGHLLNQAGVSGARPGAPHQGSAGTWGSLRLLLASASCAGNISVCRPGPQVPGSGAQEHGGGCTGLDPGTPTLLCPPSGSWVISPQQKRGAQ